MCMCMCTCVCVCMCMCMCMCICVCVYVCVCVCVFTVALRLLVDHQFIMAYKLVRDAAKQYGLYDESVKRDLARIREIGFKQHDFDQAGFLLARTAQRLSRILDERR